MPKRKSKKLPLAMPNDNYEYVSFVTNDRAVTNTDGTMEYVPWTAKCENYKLADNGIKYPTVFKAVWNYEDEDFVYFENVQDLIDKAGYYLEHSDERERIAASGYAKVKAYHNFSTRVDSMLKIAFGDSFNK